ncbi:uncharacterized protein LOC112514955 [Cynara cardunculus var. scolymus]|uniref:uncharacterized protein LOC112514955 n=1 Tax=Cynara cardunculus var. scolymus TaxID=59895 RepID=UPI000D6305F0|nr:uncharacterized protein LOC112514955 [Cynara cardunculus var. scolymus]
MARSRGRSSGAISRPAPQPAKSPTRAPSPAPQQSRPTTGGLGSVVAEGMAFGAGNAVAHRAVDSMMGPRVIQLETVTPSAANTANLDACVGQHKAFQDCLDTSANDISRCQFYMNMLIECRKAGSASGTSMA